MNKEHEILVEEVTKRFQFLYGYKPSKPTNYKPQTLWEIKGNDKTVFNHDVLMEMRNGKIDQKHVLFEILYNVKEILLTEAYNSFSEFMGNLRTDELSLQNSNNEVRRVYNGFVSGSPQRWKLIDPDEYLRCIQQYSYQKPQSGAYDDYWAPRIMEWVANAKDNVAQLAANSYLTSGPTLDQDSENASGQNLHALLWYNLTGDEEIPYKPGQCGNDSMTEREFFNKYWRPFTKYIQTSYGDGAEAYETDSPLDGLFNIVAEFDRHYSDPKKLFVALDRLKNTCHGRGNFGHIFMKGGNAACERISNFS